MDSKLTLEVILSRLLQLKNKEYATDLLNTMIAAAIADDDFKRRIEIKNQLQLIADAGITVNIMGNIAVILVIERTEKDGNSMSILKDIIPKK